MEDTEILLRNIELKINKITLRYQEEREKNKAILIEQQKLLDLVSEQQNIIDELKENNKLLKIKNIVEYSTDSKEMKLKINELVREIDKCIDSLQNNEVS